MIYVFEGVDGSGKTTLANGVSSRLRVPTFPDPGRHGLLADWDSAHEWLVRGTQYDLDIACFSRIFDFVVDRWILSSRVYGRRRREVLDDPRARHILEIAEAHVFVLEVPSVVAHARMKRRDGVAKYGASELEFLHREVRGEAEFVRGCGVPVHFLDGMESVPVLIGEVVELSEGR